MNKTIFAIIAVVIVASSSIFMIINYIEEQKKAQDYNDYVNKGFSDYEIQQIINCDPTDTDRSIRLNRIANETHQFDKIDCVWNKLK